MADCDKYPDNSGRINNCKLVISLIKIVDKLVHWYIYMVLETKISMTSLQYERICIYKLNITFRVCLVKD